MTINYATKVERHKQICLALNALYAMKNHDYGDVPYSLGR